METSKENLWIVILEKAPRGPLTTAEVQTLLSRGMLRMNDLALPVVPGAPKSRADWKFVWQFPDFDRRSAVPIEDNTQEMPIPERRAEPISQEKTRSLVQEALPAELLDLPVEDLIPKANRRIPSFDESLVVPEDDEDRAPSVPFWSRSKWLAGAGVGAAGLILLVRMFGPSSMTSLPPVRVPASQKAVFDTKISPSNLPPSGRPHSRPYTQQAPLTTSAPVPVRSSEPASAQSNEERSTSSSSDRSRNSDELREDDRRDEKEEGDEETGAKKKKGENKTKRKPDSEEESEDDRGPEKDRDPESEAE